MHSSRAVRVGFEERVFVSATRLPHLVLDKCRWRRSVAPPSRLQVWILPGMDRPRREAVRSCHKRPAYAALFTALAHRWNPTLLSSLHETRLNNKPIQTPHFVHRSSNRRGAIPDAQRRVCGARAGTSGRWSAFRKCVTVPSDAEGQTESHVVLAHEVNPCEPEKALPGRSSSILVNPTFHDIFGIPVQKVPKAPRWPTSHSVASGCRGCSGKRQESPYWLCRWHAQPHVRGGVPLVPATEIVKVSYDLPRSATRSCSRSSSRTMTRHRACGEATTSGRSTGRRSTTSPEQLATAERVRDEFQTAFNRAGYGRIDRDRACRRLLLRGGLSPAVPGQEPLRLLPGACHWSDL